MATFNQKLQQATINAQRKAETVLRKDRRQAQRLKEAGARERVPTVGGLSKQKLAALQAAEKRLSTDPRAVALIDRAETERQMQEVRSRLKIGKLPPPPGTSVFDRTVESATGPAKTVAQMLAEKREADPTNKPVPVATTSVLDIQQPSKGRGRKRGLASD